MAVAPVASTAADVKLADHTRHQVALRLLPFLFILYIANYLDRTSVAYAAIGMSRTLGFNDRVFGLGAGIFFVSNLENREASVQNREKRDMAAHNGHLTKAEQNGINRQQNRISKSIYKDKHK